MPILNLSRALTSSFLLLVSACAHAPPPGKCGTPENAGLESALEARPASTRDWQKYPAIVTLDAIDIYAMGDVHGDPDAQLRTLEGAGLIAGDGPLRWTGGRATLIVTGDVIDKGSRSLPAIDNFRALQTQAAASGGRVVVTLGNHEAGFIADPDNKKAKEFHAELEAAGESPKKVAKGRGPYGEWLHQLPFAAIAGEWFFSHAGDGQQKSVAQLAHWFQKRYDEALFDEIAQVPLLDARKDWWWDDDAEQSRLDDVLGALPVKHLVYGHQPEKVPCPPGSERPKQTLFTCYDGKIFFLDVGMSSAVSPSSRGGLLHIERGPSEKVTAMYPDGSKTLLWAKR